MVKIFQNYLGKRLSKFLLISFCPSLLGKLKPETQKRRKKKKAMEELYLHDSFK